MKNSTENINAFDLNGSSIPSCSLSSQKVSRQGEIYTKTKRDNDTGSLYSWNNNANQIFDWTLDSRLIFSLRLSKKSTFEVSHSLDKYKLQACSSNETCVYENTGGTNNPKQLLLSRSYVIHMYI